MKKSVRKDTRRSFSWEKRDEDLKRVKRYHAFKIMLYRTNLLVHSWRVQGILQKLIPGAVAVYPDFNPELALLISRFHDDHEMISGDVPLQMKLLMDQSAYSALTEADIRAANMLSADYGNPVIGEYRYIDLLTHGILKNCPEAQLHSLADKIDGYGEALHEVLAGNLGFLDAVMNYVGKAFNDPSRNFPLIKETFTPSNEFFHFPPVELRSYFQFGKVGAFLHTSETVLEKKTGVLHYEMWKQVTLSLPGGMELLTKQVEFHHR